MKILKYTLFTIGLMLLFKSNIYALEEVEEIKPFGELKSYTKNLTILEKTFKIDFLYTPEETTKCRITYTWNNNQIYTESQTSVNNCYMITMIATTGYSGRTDQIYIFKGTKPTNNEGIMKSRGTATIENGKIKITTGNGVSLINTGLQTYSNPKYVAYYNTTNGTTTTSSGYVLNFSSGPCYIEWSNTTINITDNYDNHLKYYDFRYPQEPEPPQDNFPLFTSWYNIIIQEITKTITFVVNDTILTATIGILFIIFIIEILKKLLK